MSKFCKICQDAGKSESQYTSHWPRSSADPTSTVVCPTLLAQECGYCFKNGHTPKYCPALAAHRKEQDKATKLKQKEENQKKKQAEEEQTKKQQKNLTNSRANVFSLLDDDEEEEEVKPTKQLKQTQQVNQRQTQVQAQLKQEEFPALMSSGKTTKSTTNVAACTLSYASIASKPQTKSNEQEILASSMKRQIPVVVHQTQSVKKNDVFEEENQEQDDEEEYVYTPPKKVVLSASLLDWAQLYDSDDEDW